ncbi:MAG: peptide chain release factor N(5)-glutamine methyltransferase [Clostridia bacterium]|nr:peptide chain release factor N(5)-glutamine methyltransferase [Clostridia bacterium]
MTPRELLKLLAADMTAAGVPDAEVDASLLLSHVTGQNPMNLRLDSWSQVSLADEAVFRALCERRMTRTPLQYLTGVQSFLGRDFYVDERVLIPRPETELLAERAIAALRAHESPAALDLCCGSGCLAVSMALGVPRADVHAADLSEGALAVTRLNADRLGAKITRHQGDLWAALPAGLAFDVIVSNPPYIPAADCLELQEEVRREPMMALDGGTDGYDFYRRIAAEAPRFLKPGGTLLMEVGFDQAQGVMALCRAAGFTFVTAHEDYQHILRMVEARL